MKFNTDAIIRDLMSLGWKKFPRKRADVAVLQYDNGEHFFK